MTGLTYATLVEGDADRALLELCREALNVSPSCLRLDDCGLWALHGKRGRVMTWGDTGYLLHVYDERTADKKRLSELSAVMQDGECGGAMCFELPIGSEVASVVREIAGLRVKASEE